MLLFVRNVQNILNDPSLMHQIQQMSATIQRTEELKNELSVQEQRQLLLQQQQEEFNQQIQQPPPVPQPPYGHPPPVKHIREL